MSTYGVQVLNRGASSTRVKGIRERAQGVRLHGRLLKGWGCVKLAVEGFNQ
jgi:hypothetical protein